MNKRNKIKNKRHGQKKTAQRNRELNSVNWYAKYAGDEENERDGSERQTEIFANGAREAHRRGVRGAA